MKKFWLRIKDWSQIVAGWWMLHFRNTIVAEVEFDAFTVEFRRFSMKIKTNSGNLELKTVGMLYPNAFLLDALNNEDEKIIEWYCYKLYEFVSLITTDAGLVNDVEKAFQKYYKRNAKKAASNVKATTAEDDTANQAIVEVNAAYASMTQQEKEALGEAIREELREEAKKWAENKSE